MSQQQGTVILGAAIGYREAQIEPFLKSLRTAGYQGDVVLIVSPALAKRAATNCVFRDVVLLTAQQWFPARFRLVRRPLLLQLLWAPQRCFLWLAIRLIGLVGSAVPGAGRLLRSLAVHLYPPSEVRYLHYLNYLEKTAHSRILLSDVRDVVFQDDPFRSLPEKDLAVSMEVANYTIASEPYNAQWVRNVYGAAVLERLGGNQVSCSGVTCGDRQAMLRYLRLMADEIVGMSYGAMVKALGGYDQGIHNVLLNTGKLDLCERMYSLESPVATVNNTEATNLKFDDRGRLLNQDGTLVAVVHQYDRVQGLKERLFSSLAIQASS